MRYVCDPKNLRKTSQEIWETTLIEFNKADDIELAYPTQRFFNHLKEK